MCRLQGNDVEKGKYGLRVGWDVAINSGMGGGGHVRVAAGHVSGTAAAADQIARQPEWLANAPRKRDGRHLSVKTQTHCARVPKACTSSHKPAKSS